jgi:hypothetical protein
MNILTPAEQKAQELAQALIKKKTNGFKKSSLPGMRLVGE